MASNEMLCPVDRTPLVMSERQNIEIDYCPTCRGVWLDRGELDKIIERSASVAPPPPPPPAQPVPPGQPWGQPQQAYGHGHGYPHKKRRKSFLEELFD